MIESYKNLFINSKELEIERKISSVKLNYFNSSILESSIGLKQKLQERKQILKEIEIKGSEYNNDNFVNKITYGDCLDYLYKIKPNSVDLFLSDIPYGINLDERDVFHNNTNSAFHGTASEAQLGKSGFKKRGKPINGWNEEDKENNQKYEEWISIRGNMIFPILKEGASVLLFGGRRTIHKAVNALENVGFLPKDILFWEKNSFNYRNQSLLKTISRRGKFKIKKEGIQKLEKYIYDIDFIQKLNDLIGKEYLSSKDFINNLNNINKDIVTQFTYEILDSFQEDENILQLIKKRSGWKVGTLAPKIEPIAWLMKPYSSPSILDNILKNGVGGINIDKCKINGKEPTNLLNINFNKDELYKKIHEAQKPIDLIEFLINLTTNEDSLVLDPFMGSGTTALACKNLKRNYIGFEKNEDIYKNSINRLI